MRWWRLGVPTVTIALTLAVAPSVQAAGVDQPTTDAVSVGTADDCQDVAIATLCGFPDPPIHTEGTCLVLDRRTFCDVPDTVQTNTPEGDRHVRVSAGGPVGASFERGCLHFCDIPKGVDVQQPEPSIGVYQETNGCEGLQTEAQDCDDDGETEPPDEAIVAVTTDGVSGEP